MADSSSRQTPVSYRLRKWLLWFSIVASISLSTIHFFQWDWLAPVTLIPPWLWFVPGTIAILAGFKSVSRGTVLFAVALWCLFGFLFVEEARSFLRFGTETPDSIRVASINCCMGSYNAALEPMKFQPQVVFFQESMGPEPLKDVAEEYFGPNASAIHGGDVSIISAASLKAIHVDPATHFIHVVATFEDGQQCDFVCLRLSAPVFRIDCLSSGFWAAHRETRQHHRQQLETIVTHLNSAAETDHWIIGGDFNLVGNDGALSAFDHLRDTFFEAGSGWCNTGTNDYPLFRVDQVWTSKSIQCEMQRVYRTEHSDHRMVVVDLDF